MKPLCQIFHKKPVKIKERLSPHFLVQDLGVIISFVKLLKAAKRQKYLVKVNDR